MSRKRGSLAGLLGVESFGLADLALLSIPGQIGKIKKENSGVEINPQNPGCTCNVSLNNIANSN